MSAIGEIRFVDCTLDDRESTSIEKGRGGAGMEMGVGMDRYNWQMRKGI